MEVGFSGLGKMGSGMAANLLRAGHTVSVFNRTVSKMEPLVQLGARAHDHVEAVCNAEAVFTMLADDRAVESVVFGERGVLASLKRGATHISSSTVSVSLSARIGAAHERAGQRYLAAPVFGRPDAAANGKLCAVVGGASAVIDDCRPLLDAIASRTVVIAERPEAANLVKLSSNFLLDAVIESLGEAAGLISAGGVDPRLWLDLLTSTVFDVPVYKNFGRKIIECQSEPGGFATLLEQTKVHLTLAAADALRVPLPMAKLIRERAAAYP